MVLPEALVRKAEMLQQSLFISASSLSQIAGRVALGERDYAEEQKAHYAANRSLLTQGEAALGPFYGMMLYHLGLDAERARGGKRLRPLLCSLVFEAIGGDGARVNAVGAAVELLHNFTLIHDDIEDQDPRRHHRPTVWSVWGVPQAINAALRRKPLVSRDTRSRTLDRPAPHRAACDERCEREVRRRTLRRGILEDPPGRPGAGP